MCKFVQLVDKKNNMWYKITMENKIQMIITDLDRSLLSNERIITKYTKNILEECIKRGIILVFATARPFRATKIFYDKILPHAVICHNGAVVFINKEQIYQCGIKTSIVKEFLTNIIKNNPNTNLAIECEDTLYTNFDPEIYWSDVVYKNIEIENLPEKNIDKIIIGLETLKNIDQIKKYLSDDLYFEISKGKVGLVMNKNATKWNAIKILLEYYKIGKENSIAFGDDYNDIEMIENCGIGVSVENGIEEIKAKAKYICGKNNEDGIAKWIEENILKQN